VSDAVLLPLLYILPVFDWIAAVTLFLLARQRPYIAFLTVSTLTTFVIALATSVYAIVATNTAQGFAWFAFSDAVTVNRVVFVLLGAVPLAFLAVYWRRRRGDG